MITLKTEPHQEHVQPDAELGADERAELEKLRAENARLKMERDFAKKVATWFAKDQP